MRIPPGRHFLMVMICVISLPLSFVKPAHALPSLKDIITNLRRSMTPIAQQGDKLCWAACTHMVIRFQNQLTPQIPLPPSPPGVASPPPLPVPAILSEFSLAFDNYRWTTLPTPDISMGPDNPCFVDPQFNKIGIPFSTLPSNSCSRPDITSLVSDPFIRKCGYNFHFYSTPTDVCLDSNALKNALDGNGPIIAQLKYNGTANYHFVVISDYSYDKSGTLVVTILNPMPVTTTGCDAGGSTIIIPFATYVKSSFKIMTDPGSSATVKTSGNLFNFIYNP